MAISYLLSLVFLGGLALVAGLLLLTAWRARNPRSTLPGDLPVDPERYGPLQTNRWLKLLRFVFVIACAVTLGFHGYWAFGVDANEGYNAAMARDLRQRRLAEAGLKGWVFDRTGKADNAIIRYSLQGQDIVRTYPLGEAAVHVTGYQDFIYGSGGIERAYNDFLTEPTSLRNALSSTVPVGKDLHSTVDAELQKFAYEQIKTSGKPSAVVVLSVPNSEVLAAASFPSFDPHIINDEAAWKALNAEHNENPQISPMSDRAFDTYYQPGSTFKVLVAVAALESGLGDKVFPCSGGGFYPPAGGQVIVDDNGGGGHGNPNLAEALRVSCNQYFAQMALALGPERLGEVARRFGIATDLEGSIKDTNMFRFGVADARDFARAIAPPRSRLIPTINPTRGWEYREVALQGFGQGKIDITLLQLALIAAGVANPNGQLVKPTFEQNLEPQLLGQVCSPQNAQIVRNAMKLVVDQGTATRAFAPLQGRISAAGKTGTAQREVIVYDPKTRKPVLVKNSKGEDVPRKDFSIDAFFMGFAPFEAPTIAFAVIVEGGGHGGEAAAPIAAAICEKARELGYIEAPAPPQGAPRAGLSKPVAPRPKSDRPRPGRRR